MAPCSVVGSCLGEVTGAPFCVNGKMIMFLTAKESAKELGISEPAFRRCVERGEIPPACLNCRPRMWAVSQLDSIGKGSNVATSSDELMERIHENQNEIPR